MSHMKHMAAGFAGLFAVLVVAGVPVTTALGYAVALACPLMMVTMMFGGHHRTGHRAGTDVTPGADERKRGVSGPAAGR